MPEQLEDKIQSALEVAFDEKIGNARRELAEQLQNECSAELQSAVNQAREEASRTSREELAAALSAAGRQIRSKDSVTDIAVALVETAAQFCGRSALFIQKGKGVLGFRAQGFRNPDLGQQFQQLDVPLTDAAAIGRAVESRETVVASGTAQDVSGPIAELFGLSSEDQVHLFPVTLRDKVLAVLYADGADSSGDVQTAALELLTNVTEAWLEAVGTRKKQSEAASAQ